ncbi:protein SET-like [Sabethes cyaneus]|uniref:protein SET-like n=1 Tax=Sabethes cyaneus TaxID=53552 RepID=UPI00237ED6C3|nr:protein SET-like [Sabethes cyaneus]
MASIAKRMKKSDDGLEDESEALEALDSCQNEINALNEKSIEEGSKVAQKYYTLLKPFFQKRNEISKRIPSFWATAIVNHPQISGILEEGDEGCLQFLEKLEAEDIKNGYRIHFYFDANPYFENKILTKELKLETLISTSTAIKWKPDRGLTKMLPKKALANRRKRSLEYRTFLDWFTDNNDPISDDIAESIRNNVWAHPLQYYLMPAVEIEPEAEEDGSEEQFDDEAGEEEEEDELDEEEEEA